MEIREITTPACSQVKPKFSMSSTTHHTSFSKAAVVVVP